MMITVFLLTVHTHIMTHAELDAIFTAADAGVETAAMPGGMTIVHRYRNWGGYPLLPPPHACCTSIVLYSITIKVTS